MTQEETYCCSMRRHFLVGIVGERSNEEAPIDVADFMISFDPPIISIKYCPFCGKSIDNSQSLRTGTRIE